MCQVVLILTSGMTEKQSLTAINVELHPGDHTCPIYSDNDEA